MAKKTSPKKKDTKRKQPSKSPEVQGLLVLGGALIVLISLFSFSFGHETRNWLGLLGFSVGWIFHALLGVGSYIICLYFMWIGWRLLFSKVINCPYLKATSITTLIISLCMLLSLIENEYPEAASAIGNAFYPGIWHSEIDFHLGGAPSHYLYFDLPALNLSRILNTTGVIILFSTTLLASVLFLAKITPAHILAYIQKLRNEFAKTWREEWEFSTQSAIHPTEIQKKHESDFMRFVKLRIPGQSQNFSAMKTDEMIQPGQDLLAIQPEANPTVRPSLSRKTQTAQELEPIAQFPPPIPQKPLKDLEKPSPQKKRESALIAQRVHNGDFSEYKLPPLSLLTNPKKVDQTNLKKDLKKGAEVLEETLSSFGIEAKVGQINCGPTITSYEVHPSIGVKVQKIKALENDIALNMEAKSIRIIAPIPGKAAVGIEVPNPQPQEVSFKEMLQSYQQGSRKFHVPILLGKAVNGDYVMSDLTKMPHCIIAGATGSGKSVCINSIVMSIVMNHKPDEIKLLMVDPKKVELTPYSKLPHMLAPVITEPQGAYSALIWMVKEMESRYELLKQLGLRNIESFNTRSINQELEASLDKEIPAKMCYIVGIIDELADLMMSSNSDIETPIARIAQMARAVGIHLILATQRPSREVITGIIKANFPTRISFKVASRINSQIVLDEVGAESLLGNGDMLFLPPGTSHLLRAQGAFIRDEDINHAIKCICDQAPPNYIIQSFDKIGYSGEDALDSAEDNSGDSLYAQALDIVLGTGNASTTFLQRKLKIGYARAASLMDELQSKGVVSPADGSKARKVLMAKAGLKKSSEELEENHDGDHEF